MQPLPAWHFRALVLQCRLDPGPLACSMTTGAQQALRRTMEIYSSTTRFALACNTSSKIIEPIQSRCAIVRFTRLGDQEVLARLLHVCREEKVTGLQGRLRSLHAHWGGAWMQARIQPCRSVAAWPCMHGIMVCDLRQPLALLGGSSLGDGCLQGWLTRPYMIMHAMSI